MFLPKYSKFLIKFLGIFLNFFNLNFILILGADPTIKKINKMFAYENMKKNAL